MTQIHRLSFEPWIRRWLFVSVLLAVLAPVSPVDAFCGFYVAKAEADLWNEASQVALVRDGDRTVLTMSNDFKGDLKEFALVVPVPTVLEKDQINVGERVLIDRLDAFSAPRLVEYHDPDPCQEMMVREMAMAPSGAGQPSMNGGSARAKSLGVTIEATYTVGEYDILILSAKQSDGLETWLRENGYKLPKGASTALQPYIRQELKFFVAKVNIKEQAKTGYTYLRPLQMAFESPRFMLPIRLGMLNARGPQDLIVYAMTRKGRVETSNYRTVRVPSGVEIPQFAKAEFKDFYRAMFEQAWQREGQNVAFLEYFWDMGWCDPCAADPLSPEELRQLGVFWLDDGAQANMPPPARGARDVVLTRLHIRYDEKHFPEDLMFQETRDKENFQGRFVIRNAWTGPADCPAGKEYKQQLRVRNDKEAETIASLTGWELATVRSKMGYKPEAPPTPVVAPPTPTPVPWWRRIWSDKK